MIVTTKPRWFIFRMLQWQWKFTLFYLVLGAGAWGVHELGVLNFKMPALVLGILGSALAIFISFRTNAAYDRWWEGRKLWGRMINTSRHWGQQIMAYIPEGELQRALVHRHIAYVHTLRVLLRLQKPMEDADLVAFLDTEETQELAQQSNGTHYLLSRQLKAVNQAFKDEVIDGLHLQSLDESLRHFLDIQGGCERIKKTPMPPAYGLVGTRLTQIFGILLPVGLVHDIGWQVIPLNLVLCLSFTLINELGRVLEDPFNMFYNGLPLSNISKMIEVNLLQCAGETDLPEIPGPNPPGILM